MRKVNQRTRIVYSVASSFLLLLSAVAPRVLTAGVPRAYVQTGSPDIRGTYQGQSTDSSSCFATFMSPITVSIITEQGQSFAGTAIGKGGTPVNLNGTVDASGLLSGTYGYQIPVRNETGRGTFTGQVTGTQIRLSLMGMIVVPSETCTETIMITATRQTSASEMSDLSITGTGSPSQVASGARTTFSLMVSNAGPADATGAIVIFPTPTGTTIAASTASQGQVQGAGSGSTGNVICFVGDLAKGATATLSFTLNVLAPGGSTLTTSPFVVSNVFDPSLANNSTTVSSTVVGGAVLELVWDQPTPTAANPTPAPENLRVVVVIAVTFAPATAALGSGGITPQDSCTLMDVNVYKSDQPNVQTIPANLWETVPPDMLHTTMPAAPAWSFYVITNLWNCAGTIIESGPSNEASVPAGPTITRLKVTTKLKALGIGFSGPVQVLVDGVGFVKKAVLQGTTTVVQKGRLTDGVPVSRIGAKTSVLVTIVNKDGGVGTFAFKKP
jgi:uncharacterized repeat protein (TIGR01451 family)